MSSAIDLRNFSSFARPSKTKALAMPMLNETMSVATAGFRSVHRRTRVIGPACRARIGSLRCQRSKSSASCSAEP
jgi:hypothetical protein